MIPSVVPFKTPLWRITPSELAGLVGEAQRYLQADASHHSVPAEGDVSWVTITKQGRQDNPAGTTDEVTATLSMPRVHAEAGVQLRAADRTIQITMSTHGAEITLKSRDQNWLQLAEPWAQQAVAKFTPRWAWLASWRGILATVLASFVGGYTVLIGAESVGLSSTAAILLVATLQLLALGTYGVVITRPRVIIGDTGAPRARAVGAQAAILVIGTLLGILGTRTFDLLFPLH